MNKSNETLMSSVNGRTWFISVSGVSMCKTVFGK